MNIDSIISLECIVAWRFLLPRLCQISNDRSARLGGGDDSLAIASCTGLLLHAHTHIAGLVEALVDSACDREGVARDAIFKSLVDIGRRRYNIVLEITHRYLAKHNKVCCHGD